MRSSTFVVIQKALQRELGDAEDNLRRAQCAFRNDPSMDANYGESGYSKQSIVNGYQERYSRATRAIDDFNNG